MKADRERVKALLLDTVTLLCQTGLTYRRGLRIQGLLAVTLDDQDIFVVQINESVSTNQSAADWDGSDCAAKQHRSSNHWRSSNGSTNGHATVDDLYAKGHLISCDSDSEGARGRLHPSEDIDDSVVRSFAPVTDKQCKQHGAEAGSMNREREGDLAESGVQGSSAPSKTRATLVLPGKAGQAFHMGGVPKAEGGKVIRGHAPSDAEGAGLRGTLGGEETGVDAAAVNEAAAAAAYCQAPVSNEGLAVDGDVGQVLDQDEDEGQSLDRAEGQAIDKDEEQALDKDEGQALDKDEDVRQALDGDAVRLLDVDESEALDADVVRALADNRNNVNLSKVCSPLRSLRIGLPSLNRSYCP